MELQTAETLVYYMNTNQNMKNISFKEYFVFLTI